MPLLVPDSNWTPPTELPDLRRCKEIGLDTETRDDGLAAGRGPGWAYGAGYLCGVSAAWSEGGSSGSFYAPVAHPDTECFPKENVARWVEDHRRAGVRLVMQNAPYDVGWLDADAGVRIDGNLDDTTCLAYMVDEQRRELSLSALCAWRGVAGKDETLLREAAEVYGVDPKSGIYLLPARYVGPYAAQDAASTLALARSLRPELAREGTEKAYELEMDLVPMVHAMRKRGVRVDVDRAPEVKRLLLEQADATFRELSEKLGTRVGIDEVRRNDWLVRAFDSQKLRYPIDPETKRASFEAKWMKNDPHWLPQLLVRAKSRYEAAEKFVQGFIVDYAHRGRLHANVNSFRGEQGGTRTFRFSYSDPPLQQMPARDEELAALIRGLFLPEDGEVWAALDYSQQEYRLMVHYAAKAGLPKAAEAAAKYASDPRTDFHSLVAELTGLARKPAKDSNFAKSYGAGVEKFASMINKTVEEARAIMTQYDDEMPFVAMLAERMQASAERKGYVRLLDGARIHFDTWEPAWLSREERARGWSSGGRYKMGDCDLEEARARQQDPDHPWYGKRLRRAKCRKAMNSLIQGGAARQTKLAMRACWREGLLPLLQMHDELGFSVGAREPAERAAEVMRSVVPLRVPMMVDVEVGATWGAATQSWDDYAAGIKA